MKSYTADELKKLKPTFLTWVADECECEGDCECYGPDEYDEVHTAVVYDDGVCTIFYGPRSLTYYPDDHPQSCGELVIEHDGLEWVGDDVDYYGNVIWFLIDIDAKRKKEAE